MPDFSSNLPLNIVYAGVLVIFLLADFLHIFSVHTNIFIVISVIGVIPVAISAVRALITRKITVDLLASIALVFSFIAGEWHSAAFINLMLSLARVLDIWTEARTNRTIEQLMKYRPAKVKIQKGQEIVEIPTDQVKVDDIVVIEDGERVPVDGVVVSGAASINESTLTGESELVSKKAGSIVFSSTYNESGSLLVKAQRVGKDSTLSRIILLIEEASRNKAPTEKIADKFTQWYITIMLIGAVSLYFLLQDASMVLSILLVVCADDIAICVPLTFTLAIARGANRGILIKGSDVIEKLSHIRVFITDKTGTLTHGKPKISEIKIFGNHAENQILEYLGLAAANSSHPVDTAIIKYLKDKGVVILAPDTFLENPGEGMTVEKDGIVLRIGKIEYLLQNGAVVSADQQAAIDKYRNDGLSISALGINREVSALVVFEDEVKLAARPAIAETKKMGVSQWIMITGDNEKVASRIAGCVGIDSYKYNVRPEEKLELAREIKKKTNGIVAMVGDGVNDAAALALSDVSIAMGAIGSDVAIEAADVALMNDKLERIPEAMMLGKLTMEVVRMNFVIWGITNFIGLLLVTFGVLNPVGASTYNFVTDFFPILNSLRVGFQKMKANTS